MSIMVHCHRGHLSPSPIPGLRLHTLQYTILLYPFEAQEGRATYCSATTRLLPSAHKRLNDRVLPCIWGKLDPLVTQCKEFVGI